MMLKYLLINLYMLANLAFAVQVHQPMVFLQQVADEDNLGEQIYQAYCAVCHDPEPQILLDAPRIGDLSQWEGRLCRTVDEMLDAMDHGIGAMPPRGGCFECSDEALTAAIIYMLNQIN